MAALDWDLGALGSPTPPGNLMDVASEETPPFLPPQLHDSVDTTMGRAPVAAAVREEGFGHALMTGLASVTGLSWLAPVAAPTPAPVAAAALSTPLLKLTLGLQATLGAGHLPPHQPGVHHPTAVLAPIGAHAGVQGAVEISAAAAAAGAAPEADGVRVVAAAQAAEAQVGGERPHSHYAPPHVLTHSLCCCSCHRQLRQQAHPTTAPPGERPMRDSWAPARPAARGRCDV
jgi:hypothetical protein